MKSKPSSCLDDIPSPVLKPQCADGFLAILHVFNLSFNKANSFIASLHDQNKSGLFRRPTFIPPIGAF